MGQLLIRINDQEIEMTVLKPRQAVPTLEVSTLQGSWSLASQAPENFTMVVF